MLTQLQLSKFEEVLCLTVEKLCNYKLQSNEQVYKELQTLNIKQKKGIWNFIAQQIGSTQEQVHDYYFNTWSLQFYEDAGPYRQFLHKQLIKALETLTYKEAIQHSLAQFRLKYPNNKCNERKIYQILYQNVPKDIIEQNKTKEISIFENLAFQKAINKFQ
ncbi:Conserved_hypothetical protein [Hexamita inflata]|uniref:Uncharacterized protein n=1 Tax=Hexamita inflata TaxID=28002 RepID=A0AA86R449_9EUKA|nr:Conserved hypothetical protein [Hexamita inflata]